MTSKGNAGNPPTPTPAPVKSQPLWHNLVSGGIAGVSEILVMYPLDVVKTRQQLQVGKGQSMMSSLVTMVRHDGLKMYRGIVPPILVEAPKRAIKFASNKFYEKQILSYCGNTKPTQMQAIGSGVLAGITEAFIVVPFELVKIRLQAKENAGKYTSTMDCVNKTFRAEGLSGFFKGLESTIWRHACWNGGYFGLIHTIKSALPKPTTEQGVLVNNFIAGGLAGTFGTMLNTPADVVKSRIQNQVGAGKYNWCIPSILTVAREEGFSALYKGFLPKVLRLGPGGGILLVVNEFVMKLLAGKN
ncbi:mitochondrial substrate carrier family protein [Dictyostelium discoideum AX4]|uniref:Probable mitochondrial 2-oxodicarboxylate carrier n=1 Tax=Dictyostelium discoideum TaxID=44689 RepID=ODC_DICDI|nr:mitochondrial substrate carrier family protein [Dictyostelium discoideum AX4]Q55GE2.1 RecName: Full=Probable mitochondrial 2-oxodicarboxylate carrier; AltName: Full=Solute carrier family 25 member 21 [Dictyostelium discoideum]EAL73305.1 mitochondrial substrate carrier family protein [Dictyostelium discoideum AX4]|eukprot:XP_647242.1 mitochondrial substrate carrier family protein [Dictyostelium discoideum AX4]